MGNVITDIRVTSKLLNYRPRTFQFILHFIINVILFATLQQLYLLGEQWSWMACQFLIPILIFRCFALMHDAVHSSVFRSEFLNNMIGVIAGAFCFLPFYAWKKIHLEHHRWAGNFEK